MTDLLLELIRAVTLTVFDTISKWQQWHRSPCDTLFTSVHVNADSQIVIDKKYLRVKLCKLGPQQFWLIVLYLSVKNVPQEYVKTSFDK